MDTLLERRHPRLVGPDLADDPGPDPGVADTIRRLADELVGEVIHRPSVDQRLCRVVGASIPATAHDDAETGRARDTSQPHGIPADTRHREVDDTAATGLAERRELLEDERL